MHNTKCANGINTGIQIEFAVFILFIDICDSVRWAEVCERERERRSSSDTNSISRCTHTRQHKWFKYRRRWMKQSSRRKTNWINNTTYYLVGARSSHSVCPYIYRYLPVNCLSVTHLCYSPVLRFFDSSYSVFVSLKRMLITIEMCLLRHLFSSAFISAAILRVPQTKQKRRRKMKMKSVDSNVRTHSQLICIEYDRIE